MPKVRDQYVDPVLTDISIKHTNPQSGFVNGFVFPVKEVPKDTGIYFKYDKSNLRAAVDSRRKGMAASAEMDYNMDQDTYGPLEEHSLKKGITQEEMDNYDSPLEPRT